MLGTGSVQVTEKVYSLICWNPSTGMKFHISTPSFRCMSLKANILVGCGAVHSAVAPGGLLEGTIPASRQGVALCLTAMSASNASTLPWPHDVRPVNRRLLRSVRRPSAQHCCRSTARQRRLHRSTGGRTRRCRSIACESHSCWAPRCETRSPRPICCPASRDSGIGPPPQRVCSARHRSGYLFWRSRLRDPISQNNRLVRRRRRT